MILGAGGHGQTIADALLRIGRIDPQMRVLGFLDDTLEPQGWSYQGLSVLGTISRVAEIPHDGAIVAIGDNRARRQIFFALRQKGIELISVVHPTATLALDVEVGPGCYIGANAVVGVSCRIGANTIVNGAGGLGHHNQIAAHVHIGPGVQSAKGVVIGEGAQIGVGTTLHPGCRVGAWSVVGAGSLVTHDIADGVLAVGSPARAVRRLPLDDPAQA